MGGICTFWRNRRMGILYIDGSNDHNNIVVLSTTLFSGTKLQNHKEGHGQCWSTIYSWFQSNTYTRYAITFLTGTARPSLAGLHNHVIPLYAHHWKKLLATLAYHYLIYKTLSTAFQAVLPGAVKTCLRHGLNRISILLGTNLLNAID